MTTEIIFSLLRKGLPYVLALAALVGVLWWVWDAGSDHMAEIKDAQIMRMQGEHAQEMVLLDRAHQQALEVERKRAADQEEKARADMVALDTKFTKERSDAKATHERDLADVRSGALRLRDRFACAAGNPGASGAAAATGGPASMGDAGAESGLRKEDAIFFVQESDRADDITRQLTACQVILKRDRKGE